jgi:hypothetical protein
MKLDKTVVSPGFCGGRISHSMKSLDTATSIYESDTLFPRNIVLSRNHEPFNMTVFVNTITMNIQNAISTLSSSFRNQNHLTDLNCSFRHASDVHVSCFPITILRTYPRPHDRTLQIALTCDTTDYDVFPDPMSYLSTLQISASMNITPPCRRSYLRSCQNVNPHKASRR